MRLDIFDISGHHVRRPLDASLPAGEAAIFWDGRYDEGQEPSSGIYFARSCRV